MTNYNNMYYNIIYYNIIPHIEGTGNRVKAIWLPMPLLLAAETQVQMFPGLSAV